MAETIKSVLFVDYDSIRRRLTGDESGAAERLAVRVGAWVNAIETGRLFEAKPKDATRRRLLMRRCYADPALLGDRRATFMANGFQMVDCPTAEGRERNAAAVHMVLDTIDALEHPANYEEFILLSADTDLSPVLIRLRAHNRTTAIYADPDTAETYKAIADAMIDESRLVSVLLSDEEPAAEEEEVEARQAERSEVEALARRISAATNVPLFAPRTFAELFRHLVEELAENGYHFQTTAENVANRMAASGRNITRRQVVFVVKGLALKGHVFSTSDTPDRLAEVFREQVLYLCDNAGVELDARAREVLLSWIVGHVPPVAPAGSQEAELGPAPGPEAADDDAKPAAKPASGQAGRSSRRKPSRQQANAAKPAAPEPPKSEPARPVAESAKPSEEPKAAPARPATDEKPAPAAAKPATPPRPILKPAVGGSATPPRSGSSSAGSAGGARTAPAAAARTSPPPRKEPREASEADKEAVESSILAAIAEAVDVLVDDSGSKASKPSPQPTSPGSAGTAPPERRPPPSAAPAADEEPESDDIGDEIQRIIASYSRNRNRDEQR